MEEKKKGNGLVIGILVGIIVCLIGFIVYDNVLLEKELCDKENSADSGDIASEDIVKTNYTEEDVKKFLVDAYISPSGAVGSSEPEGYYFSDDGKFAYSSGGYCIREENQTISYLGTWKYDNGKLILNVKKSDVAIGGTIEQNENMGNCLVNYEHHITDSTDVIEYTILGIKDRELVLGDDEHLYSLGVPFDELKNIAQEGYSN